MSQPVDGGVGRVVSQLVADQVDRGWRVVVASPENVAAPLGEFLAGEVRAHGGEHMVWPASRAPGRGLVRELTHLRRIVATAQPDLVHLHSAKAGLDGRLLVRGRVPTVYQPHAWSFLALRSTGRSAGVLWERIAARWSDAVICVSEGERDAGVEAGVTERLLRVIPNGVPIPGESDQDGARRRLGLDDVPLVVCVGRLARQKGQDVLLDSWRSVVSRSPETRLVLVGDGPDRDRLRTQQQGVTIADGRRGVSDWLLAADVVAIPSRWEGMSLTMLDAMARARAVVSTDVSGSELLPPDARVPVDDATALAAAIAVRLADASLREREGRANLECVAALSIERATAEVARLYEDLLASRTSAGR